MFDWLSPIEAFRVDTAMITTLLVISVHLAFRAGIFSLATMGFAAIGGYTTGLLSTKEGWVFWAGIAAGVVAAAVVAALFAIPVLRLRGVYLALGTLALAEVIIITIQNLEVTNKALGLSGIPLEVNTTQLVVILLIVFVLLSLDRRSHFGRAANAVRMDERTANGLGINVRWVRVNAFVASAAIAGLAGGLDAHRTGVISPEHYGLIALIPVFTYALIGGEGHWIGPVLTCWGLIILRYQLDFADSEWANVIFGCALVLVIMLTPGGLSDPTFVRKVRQFPGRLRSRLGSRAGDPPDGPGGAPVDTGDASPVDTGDAAPAPAP